MATKSKKKAKTRKGLQAKTFSGLNQKRMKNKGGGGNRLILKQGETCPVQMLTGPKDFKEFDQHQWREGGNWYYVPCAGDECPLCDDEDAEKSKLHYKFVANVYSHREKKVLILEGPKTLATQIFYRYKRKPANFLKRVYDVTKFPTQPVTYGFELAEERPVSVKGLKAFDLEAHIQSELDRYFGEDGDGSSSKSKKKKGKTALDDDDFDDEDVDDEDDDDEDDDFEEDDTDDDDDDGDEDEDDDDDDDEEDDDEDGDDDEDPDEDEMMDKDSWAWGDLKAYAIELGIKESFVAKTKKRSELVARIVKKRGF